LMAGECELSASPQVSEKRGPHALARGFIRPLDRIEYSRALRVFALAVGEAGGRSLKGALLWWQKT
jgi:hypothetical protein